MEKIKNSRSYVFDNFIVYIVRVNTNTYVAKVYVGFDCRSTLTLRASSYNSAMDICKGYFDFAKSIAL